MERRFWYGVVLLVLFLALGLLTGWAMQRAQQPVKDTLEQAAYAALAGNMEQGAALAGKAKADWERCRDWTAAVADHAPMEEIDSLFAQMEIYAKTEQKIEFAAYCARLARLVEAIGQAHELTWQNLL